MEFKGVLLDLDGTLINTNELILKSFNHTFRTAENRILSDDMIYGFFGEPLEESFRKHAEKTSVEEMLRIFRDYNKKHHDNLATIFPGVREALAAMREQDALMSVVTSKKNDMARKGLELFGIEDYFRAMVGPDDTEKHKPEPEPVLKALELLELEPEDAVFVGDSPFDIICGNKAGVTTAAVAYSVHSVEYLKKFEPDFIIESLEEIPGLRRGGRL